MLEGSSKPKLLHLIPYDQFVPPRNGGALRCYHLCAELSKYYEVTLLTYQDKATIADPRFSEIKVINPEHAIKRQTEVVAKIKQAIRYRWYQRSLKGPAEAAVLAFYPLIKKLAKTHEFDVVLMEHLSSMQLGRLIKRKFPKALRLVDQHNVDHLLFAQNHSLKNFKNQKIYQHLKQQESQIHMYADYFLACSNHDAEGLQVLNQNKIEGIVVPNGTAVHDVTLANKDLSKPKLLFCGSLDYLPNKNGLLWFFNDIWPELKAKIPEVKLIVIGRNGHDEDYALLKQDEQIDFIGEVEDVKPYYQKGSIAIVPLLEGSGTRLKILEAMSFGLPVISTAIGAEGIDYEEKKHLLLANSTKEFLDAITMLCQQQQLALEIVKNARALIHKKYTWKIIVGNLTSKIKSFQKS